MKLKIKTPTVSILKNIIYIYLNKKKTIKKRFNQCFGTNNSKYLSNYTNKQYELYYL